MSIAPDTTVSPETSTVSSASYGRRAASGFAWFAIQAVGVKGVNIVGQVILAWLLGSADYGYVGLAYLVANFASIVQQGGIRDILIQKGGEFSIWRASATWMLFVQGAFSTLLMVGAAPVAARVFHDQRIVGLVLVLAIQNLFNALMAVPEAKLQLELRFRFLAGVAFGFAASLTLMSIAFAACGFGPYSFVLPWPIAAAARLLVMWRAARLPVWFPFDLHLWRHLAPDNGVIFAAVFFWTITWQGDYFILGRLYPKEIVGQYFWAFTVSTQTLQLMSLNVASVLTAPLAQLQKEPTRQLNGFVRAMKMLSIVAVPACVLQAALADPLVRLLFKKEWYPAIPVIQVLSIAWVFLTTQQSSLSLLKATGRYRTQLALFSACAAAFLTAVYIGARHGGIVGTAWGVATYAAIGGPVTVYLAIRAIGGRWRDVVEIHGAPIAGAVAAAGAALLVMYATPWNAMPRTLIMIATLVGGAVYLAIVRLLARPTWDAVINQLSAWKRRLRPVAPETS